jgi:hypothetical protein
MNERNPYVDLIVYCSIGFVVISALTILAQVVGLF